MNTKRWLAVGLSLLLLVISASIPRPAVIEETTTGQFNLLDFYLSSEPTIIQTVVEPGDASSRILQIQLDGAITSASGGLLGNEGYNHTFFLQQLDNVLSDESIKGILFLVNTPGGGVYESAEIRRALLKIKEQRNIPIYVSMQQIAASGGYYVSADATKIYATENTWTGSIGVIMQALNYKDFLEKNGVHMNTFASGDYKDMGSPYSELSEGERDVFNSMIDESYQMFVDIIVAGRGLPEKEVKKLADGRIYTASQALKLKLIDEIGYPEDALASMQADYNLEGCEVFKYEFQDDNLFSSLMMEAPSIFGAKSDVKVLSALLKLQQDSAPRPYYIYGGGK